MKLLLPKGLRGSFWVSVRSPQFVIVVVFLLLAGDWLGRNFLFEPPTRWLGDYLLRQRDRVQARFTRIVRIDEEDQKQILGGRVPINGIALVNAVCALVRSSPAVVVVDIDTSSEQSFAQGFRLPHLGTPVIWAVDADWESGQRGLNLRSGRLIGGRLPEIPPYGIARMPLGFDGVVRGWERSFLVNGHDELSLPSAAVNQFCKNGSNCREVRETSFGREYLFAKINLSEFTSRVSAIVPEPTSRSTLRTCAKNSRPISTLTMARAGFRAYTCVTTKPRVPSSKIGSRR